MELSNPGVRLELESIYVSLRLWKHSSGKNCITHLKRSIEASGAPSPSRSSCRFRAPLPGSSSIDDSELILFISNERLGATSFLLPVWWTVSINCACKLLYFSYGYNYNNDAVNHRNIVFFLFFFLFWLVMPCRSRNVSADNFYDTILIVCFFGVEYLI